MRSQRGRMLDAMIRVAAEKGYEGATVAGVIEAAGVSRTTFYEFFKDKEDCFLASYDMVVDVLVGEVEASYRSHEGTWPERIHAGIGALASVLARESEIARTAMVEAASAGSAVRQRYRDALFRFTPFLDEGRGFSEYANQLPATTSRLAIGGVAALLFDEIRAGRGDELETMTPELVFACLLPFVGPEAAIAEMRRELPADPGCSP